MKPNIKKIVLLMAFAFLVSFNSFGQDSSKGGSTSGEIIMPFAPAGKSFSYVKGFPEMKDLNMISVYNSRHKPLQVVAKVFYKINNGHTDSLEIDGLDNHFKLKMKKGIDTLYLRVVAEGYKTVEEKLTEDSPVFISFRMECLSTESEVSKPERKRRK